MKSLKLFFTSNFFLYVFLIFFTSSFHLNANEIKARYLTEVGYLNKYQVELKKPSEAVYEASMELLKIKDGKEHWKVNNEPSADLRVYDRKTGNWIASYKDGNLIAEAIPHGGGLKFPVSKGESWTESWTFSVGGGLLTMTSTADFKVKKVNLKINGKKYKTLRITMKNPLVNGAKNDTWKRHIRWLDLKNGRIVKEEFKDTGWNLEFIRSVLD